MTAPAVKPRKKQRKKRRFRVFALLLRVTLTGFALLAFWFGYVLWRINGYEVPKPLPNADAAIVLGAALWKDKPSPGLQERLDYAYELFERGTVKHFIVSGGLDHNGSKLTEAEGMRDYLLAKGVPAERIVLENDARSTYENLRFSQPIAAKHGWKSFIIVTHDYHASRSADIAQFLGYKNTVAAGTKSVKLSVTYNQSREVLAYTKWKLDELLMRAGFQWPGSF
ncbi:YdcF family protein [Paenibacillus aurantiacus]|uniref:YdcF family protein n=1 Tax=Paenibacillus aurantiacus TaxID=1936118 RepID=A0ABV5KZ22_9BACL